MDRAHGNEAGPKALRPLVKWPGGKAWLAPRLARILACELAANSSYFEPFVGGGAVYFTLRPARAFLSDVNPALIAFFRTLRARPRAVLRSMLRYSNTSECYYHVRAMTPRTSVGEAARFLYLNRTCWGGVFRLNRNGSFNVPFGNSGRVICRSNMLIATAAALQSVHLRTADFEDALAGAAAGDVVYADPPYTTLGQGNGFLRYNERLFRWSDQQRLARTCHDVAHRGAFVAVSGLDHPDILRLYRDWWVLKVERQSLVSRTSAGRRKVSEIVLFSRKPKCSISAFDTAIVRVASLRDYCSTLEAKEATHRHPDLRSFHRRQGS